MEQWTGGKIEYSEEWENLQHPTLRLATFGAGCFWGTDKYFSKDFASQWPNAIAGTCVGFMNPDPSKVNYGPSYEEVCEGWTGHIEVLHILYDSSKVSYEKMCKFFYSFHDPTQENRQGNDRGTQYASVIFYHSQQQGQIAAAVK